MKLFALSSSSFSFNTSWTGFEFRFVVRRRTDIFNYVGLREKID